MVASGAALGVVLVRVVLVGAGLRVVVFAGVFVGFAVGSWTDARRACRVVLVVGAHDDGVAIALRTRSAGLVIGGMLGTIVAAC